ncbi:hypothetical protein GDO78_004678 [Eleutherodactylus coqui]|uniref:Uncharacterized protein n=1 Tax=Eleutherodactylus coqui TaxID=57060 RepID=A0A8J6ET56_ELECQ|nr:hypothetical protein GDO78_004678 [Eleutherodactylus coqui]KAG9474495.1 hypothetical protein GDO78_004678 [Eleutherodactylus coqui]
MAALGIVLHLGFLAWNVFAVWQNLEVTSANLSHGANTYGGRWKYLTFLNQVLQTAFFGVCLLCDLLHLCLSNRNRCCSVLARLKDCIFAALAFPLGVHTFILPLVLIELFACSHQYPSKKNGIAVLVVFGAAYLSWVHWVHYAADIWVYPILAKLDVNQWTWLHFRAALQMMAIRVRTSATFSVLPPYSAGSGRPSKRKKKKKSN